MCAFKIQTDSPFPDFFFLVTEETDCVNITNPQAQTGVTRACSSQQ